MLIKKQKYRYRRKAGAADAFRKKSRSDNICAKAQSLMAILEKEGNQNEKNRSNCIIFCNDDRYGCHKYFKIIFKIHKKCIDKIKREWYYKTNPKEIENQKSQRIFI